MNFKECLLKTSAIKKNRISTFIKMFKFIKKKASCREMRIHIEILRTQQNMKRNTKFKE